MKITTSKPQEIILSAVRKYVEYLAPTYGPTGKKVLIIESEFNHKAVDDGHIAAQAFELRDEFENAIVQYIKETTGKTNSRVGDGTTTSALLMGAIVEEVLKDINDPLKDTDTHGISLEIQKGLAEAITKIKALTKKIKTKEELYAIAYNSFNNKEIAALISDTIFKIGIDGQLAIEDSQSMETTCDAVQGLELEKGYVSPYLINDPDKGKSIIKSPKVILINRRVEMFMEIAPIVKKLLAEKLNNIVIVAEGFGEDVINTSIVNRIRGALNILLIETPGYGAGKLEILEDLAVVIGAKIAETKEGLTLEKLEIGDLGDAERAEATKDKSIIIGGKGKKADIAAYAHRLKTGNSSKFEEDKLARRVAKLIGGVAVLKVGASTENEQKSIKAKVEDAMNATKIAFKDGVVEGAGLTYTKIETSSPVLNLALQAPRKQLETNGKKYLDKHVQDPSGVLIAALETAVSIASGLITMGSISTNKRKFDEHGNPL